MKKVETILIFLMSALVLVVLLVFLTPPLKQKVQNWIFSGERTVLGKVEGSFALDKSKPYQQTQITVVKMRENQDLLVEIYRNMDGETILWGDFRFENEKESYLTQGERSTNLSLTDLRGDGIFRIVVPAMDSKMNPRVHILEYDAERRGFVLLREGSEGEASGEAYQTETVEPSEDQ